MKHPLLLLAIVLSAGVCTIAVLSFSRAELPAPNLNESGLPKEPELRLTAEPSDSTSARAEPDRADVATATVPAAGELSEEELYNRPGPQAPSAGRRLWRFRGPLKRFQSERATVQDAHTVLNLSIAAILLSQGMAVVGDENPALVMEWGRRTDVGGVMCCDDVTCFVDFRDFPEMPELAKLRMGNAHMRMRAPSDRPLPKGAQVAPPELDQSIARLAAEALAKLEAAAAAAKPNH